MRASGFWLDRTIDEYLGEAIDRTPDKLALTAYRADREAPRRFNYRELGDLVSRAAGALRALGVGRGDVVAVQLPNWWEFVVTALACGRLGAVVNPLMPIFRERELAYMLGFAHARVCVAPKRFRGFDHAAMAEDLKAELSELQHVIVVENRRPCAGGRRDPHRRRQWQASGDRCDGPPAGARDPNVHGLLQTAGHRHLRRRAGSASVTWPARTTRVISASMAGPRMC